VFSLLNPPFLHNNVSGLFFTMKMNESEEIVLQYCILFGRSNTSSANLHLPAHKHSGGRPRYIPHVAHPHSCLLSLQPALSSVSHLQIAVALTLNEREKHLDSKKGEKTRAWGLRLPCQSSLRVMNSETLSLHLHLRIACAASHKS
jgi:hypothetical protein